MKLIFTAILAIAFFIPAPASARCRDELATCQSALDVCLTADAIADLVEENEKLRREVDLLNGYMYGGDGTRPAQPDSVIRYATEGHDALTETREVRERIWPLFQQGWQHNNGVKDCYRRECEDIYDDINEEHFGE